MRVAWLNGNPNPNFGGTEIHTVEFLKHIKNVETFLICAKGSYVDKNTDGIKKFYISFPNSLALCNTLRLAKVLKEECADVLIANNGKEYANALIAGKRAGAKVVFSDIWRG